MNLGCFPGSTIGNFCPADADRTAGLNITPPVPEGYFVKGIIFRPEENFEARSIAVNA